MFIFLSQNNVHYPFFLQLFFPSFPFLVSLFQWRSHWGGEGGRVLPLTVKKLSKIEKKIRKNREKRGKIGKKDKNREGSFTLPLLTDRAGNVTALFLPFSFPLSSYSSFLPFPLSLLSFPPFPFLSRFSGLSEVAVYTPCPLPLATPLRVAGLQGKAIVLYAFLNFKIPEKTKLLTLSASFWYQVKTQRYN